MPFYNLNIDAGALWARKLIDRMLEDEGGHPVHMPSEAAE
jgi:vanillate O-demethylase monooxygenase subunit